MRRCRSFGSLALGIALLAAPGVGRAANESEPNDTAATADALGAGAVGNGAISPTSDVDVWTMTGASISDLVFAYVDATGTLDTDSVLDVLLNDTTFKPGKRWLATASAPPTACPAALPAK